MLFIFGNKMLMSSNVEYIDLLIGCMRTTIVIVNMQLKHCKTRMDDNKVMFHGISGSCVGMGVKSGC